MFQPVCPKVLEQPDKGRLTEGIVSHPEKVEECCF
jgi:hypothetical protein